MTINSHFPDNWSKWVIPSIGSIRTLSTAILLTYGNTAIAGITINTVFIPSGGDFELSEAFLAHDPPTTRTGGGDLETIVRAAADIWEVAIEKPRSHELTLFFGWAPIQEQTGFGGLNALTNVVEREPRGAGRNTIALIRFNSDGTARFYMDPTPRANSHEPWTLGATSAMSLGLGTDPVTVTNSFDGYLAGGGPLVNNEVPTDLLTVAMHEIGHALSLDASSPKFFGKTTDSSSGTRVAEIEITSNFSTGSTFIGSIINLDATAQGIPLGHISSTIGGTLMTIPRSAGERRLPTGADILAVGEAGDFGKLNLSPSFPAASRAVSRSFQFDGGSSPQGEFIFIQDLQIWSSLTRSQFDDVDSTVENLAPDFIADALTITPGEITSVSLPEEAGNFIAEYNFLTGFSSDINSAIFGGHVTFTQRQVPEPSTLILLLAIGLMHCFGKNR